MLIDAIERYLTVRRAMGYKAYHLTRHLTDFGRFAHAKGERHLRAATAIEWAGYGYSREQRSRQLHEVVHLARFLKAEDPRHEIPSAEVFTGHRTRPTPYIYTTDEVTRILDTASRLRPNVITPLRPQLYVMLFGLIAATGLRTSEALRLTFDDISAGGVLHIRQTKFNKSRLVPLHASVRSALDSYLELRRRIATTDDHLFVGRHGKMLALPAAEAVFALVLKQANIARHRARRPRITDLRHTFATRVLEQCSNRRDAVSRHVVALSTYLGHASIKHTYWYMQATPELLADIANLAETLMTGERP